MSCLWQLINVTTKLIVFFLLSLKYKAALTEWNKKNTAPPSYQIVITRWHQSSRRQLQSFQQYCTKLSRHNLLLNIHHKCLNQPLWNEGKVRSKGLLRNDTLPAAKRYHAPWLICLGCLDVKCSLIKMRPQLCISQYCILLHCLSTCQHNSTSCIMSKCYCSNCYILL